MRVLISLVLLSLASISYANTQSVELASPDGTNPYPAGGLEEVVISLVYRIDREVFNPGVAVGVFYTSSEITLEPRNILSRRLFGYQDQEDSRDQDNNPETDRMLILVWVNFSGNWGGTDGEVLVDLVITPTTDSSTGLYASITEGYANNLQVGAASTLELDFGRSLGPTVSISPEESYECTMPNAGEVTVTASSTAAEEDPIASIQWFVDGSYAADGDSFTFDASLGLTQLEAVATTVSGDSAQDSATITVVDTQPPMVDPEAIQTGGNSKGASLYEIATNVSDVCDPNPTVTSVVGLEIQDGAKARLLRKLDQVTLEGSGLTIHVDAVDASGNSAVATIEID